MAVDDAAIAGAIRRHEERLAKDPSSLAFAQLADLYRKAGRADDAIGVCREGLKRYPQYATARLILAKTLVAEERLDEARAEVDAILQASPNDVQCHRLAAEIDRRRGRVDAAAGHLERVSALDPGDKESRALLGLLRADTASAAEGAGFIRLLRDDTFATVPFGMLCLEQGLTEEAVAVFMRILRKDPDNAEVRERLEGALRARFRRRG